MTVSLLCSRSCSELFPLAIVAKLRGVRTMQLALQWFPDSYLLQAVKQDYREVPQTTGFPGNPRFPKSPARDTENSSEETFPLGTGASLGLVQPWTHRGGPPQDPCLSQPALGFELWASCSARGCCRDGNCKVSCPGG